MIENNIVAVVYRSRVCPFTTHSVHVDRFDIFDQPETITHDGEEWDLTHPTGEGWRPIQYVCLESDISPKILWYPLDKIPDIIHDKHGKEWKRDITDFAFVYDMVNMTKLVKEKDGGAFHERMQEIKRNAGSTNLAKGFGNNGRYSF